MTPRMNMLNLYRRRGYAYAPVTLNMCPSLWEHYRTLAGDTPPGEYFEYPEGFSLSMIPGLQWRERAEPVDWRRYYPDELAEGTFFNAFGVASEPGTAESFHMKRMRHPLAQCDSLEAMQAYPFPELDPKTFPAVQESVRAAHARDIPAAASMACTIWETAWYIRDMTSLMLDMATEDPKASYLLDRIAALSCQQAASFARAGVDVIELGDDIGMQQTIMMSLDMYRTWLKPRLAAVIDAARAEKPDVLVLYHSCGFVEPFIEDLMEAGVDILNPVQPECMNFGDLHARYGKRLSFNGTLGTQSTMPFGTPDEVRDTVWRNLETAGPEGGLYVTPTHLLEPDVPWDNVVAYVEACKTFHKVGG